MSRGKWVGEPNYLLTPAISKRNVLSITIQQLLLFTILQLGKHHLFVTRGPLNNLSGVFIVVFLLVQHTEPLPHPPKHSFPVQI